MDPIKSKDIKVDRPKKSGFALKLTHRPTGVSVSERDLPKFYPRKSQNTAELCNILERKVREHELSGKSD